MQGDPLGGARGGAADHGGEPSPSGPTCTPRPAPSRTRGRYGDRRRRRRTTWRCRRPGWRSAAPRRRARARRSGRPAATRRRGDRRRRSASGWSRRRSRRPRAARRRRARSGSRHRRAPPRRRVRPRPGRPRCARWWCRRPSCGRAPARPGRAPRRTSWRRPWPGPCSRAGRARRSPRPSPALDGDDPAGVLALRSWCDRRGRQRADRAGGVRSQRTPRPSRAAFDESLDGVRGQLVHDSRPPRLDDSRGGPARRAPPAGRWRRRRRSAAEAPLRRRTRAAMRRPTGVVVGQPAPGRVVRRGAGADPAGRSGDEATCRVVGALGPRAQRVDDGDDPVPVSYS